MRGRISDLVVAAGAALCLSGCVKEARIAVPSDVAAAAERIELTGMGGGERGQLRLGASQGRFTRALIRERDEEEALAWSVGGGSFEVSGSEVGGMLAGECSFDEAEVELGSVVLPAERFAYRCRFRRDGQPISARLILEEVPTRPGSLLSGRTRAGEIRMDGRVLEIRPIHETEGGRLPTGTPLGYAFQAEGKQLGAIDLNGTNKTIYAPRSGPEREVVLAASLALSVLWDPAD